MHIAANSSQPELPSSILLWYWGASLWFALCLSAHLASFFPPASRSHRLFLWRTRLPVSHSFSLICFPVWQSKHCPSDTSVCVYGYPSICEDGNEMWSDRRLDLLYAAILHALCLSIRSEEYLISEAGLSSGQRWARCSPASSRPHHQSANKDAHK